MERSLRLLGLLMMLACLPVHAQTNENTTVLARSACNAIFVTLGWKDGQTMPLREVQEILRTMKMPTGFTITPEEALNTIANLNPATVQEVVFHCVTADQQQVPPDAIVKFYFSYVLPDQTIMKTPEFVVKKVAVPASTTTTTTTTITTTPTETQP